jgi:hypothetical protein
MDKKAESHDKSNVSQSPFHSLFGRKIRTCLEDFPLIKTPKKDKSSDDKEVLASVSNPALSLPVNVEQTHKEKLKPKKIVDKRLINVKLDRQIKYGSLTNEEMEIKTNKNSYFFHILNVSFLVLSGTVYFYREISLYFCQ